MQRGNYEVSSSSMKKEGAVMDEGVGTSSESGVNMRMTEIPDRSVDDFNLQEELPVTIEANIDHNKVKKFRKDKLDRSTIVGCMIIVVFMIALIVMVILTEGCVKNEGRKGYTCADTTGSEKESWRDAYCSDPLRTDCHYLSAKKETHVHVIADLVRCDTLKFPSEKVTKVVMWDEDNFLHLADDNLGLCRIMEESFFVCHARGLFLVEGVSRMNPPDLYFKMTVNDTDPNSDFCGEVQSTDTYDPSDPDRDGVCVVNTKSLGVVEPNEKPAKCKSPDVEVMRVSTNEMITQQLDESGRFFLETSQLDNWVVWKCFLRITLSKWDRGRCVPVSELQP